MSNAMHHNIQIKQTRINHREVTLSFEDSLPQVPLFLNVEMRYGDRILPMVERIIKPQDYLDNSYIFEVPYFGKYYVSLKQYDSNGEEIFSSVLGVGATDYIYAPLIATFPVLLFVLDYLSDIKRTTPEGDPIPTIITLSRPNQFDYDHLPKDMYINPYITGEDYEEERKREWPGLFTHTLKIQRYLEELKEVSPNANFSYYLNDTHATDFLPQIIKKNNILLDQGAYIFLMDGYNTLDAIYRRFQQHPVTISSFALAIKNTFLFRLIAIFHKHYDSDLPLLKLFTSDKTQWWFIQKEEISYLDSIMKHRFPNHLGIIHPSIPTMIQKVKEAGNWDSLLELYGVKEIINQFQPLLNTSKTPVFILGNNYVEDMNAPLDDFTRALIRYYGEDCIYFYKPHPSARIINGNHTNEDQVHYLPKDFPIELLIPQNKACVVAGFNSTTSLSLSDIHQQILLDINKSNATHDNGYWSSSFTKLFLSNPTEDLQNGMPVDSMILSLLEDKENWIVMEFNEEDYDIGLYDPINDCIELYTKEANQYELLHTIG